MEGMEQTQWIERLTALFVSKVPQLDTNMDEILRKLDQALKAKVLPDQLISQLTQDLEKLIEYQLKIKDQWLSIQNPEKFKSILGVIPEYKFVNRILENKRYNNPSLNNGLYQIDLSSVDKLKKTLLSVQRYSLMNATKKQIQRLGKQNLINRQSFKQLSRRC